jgi:carbon-monoxide dehydrogenase medium subunit
LNTKFVEKEFDYIKPQTLDDALDVLAEKKNVRIYAGGTDLLVKLKMNAVTEMDWMLDINGITGLSDICLSEDNNTLSIGSTAKLSGIEKNEVIKRNYNALYEAVISMASVSIRNMGTIGGNFANASPAADTVIPVICYGGIVELVSRQGAREIPAEEFITAPGVSRIRPDELITAIKLPAISKNTGGKFIKLGRVKADIAKVSFCIVLEREGETIKKCRAAMGAVAAAPLFLREVGDFLTGRKMTRSLIKETADAIADMIRPIDDIRSTAEYRKDVTKVIAADAIGQAWLQSGGELE